MSIKDAIYRKLADSLQPEHLEVKNESDQHKDHVGWNESGETHFRVRLVCKRFRGMSRIERHRLVYETLSPEPMQDIHAIVLELSEPAGT